MNKHLVIFSIGSLLAAGAFGETSVGVSIGINQPGVYGRIDIGNYPRPAVVYGQPIIIAPQPMVVRPQPVYLYVPPGHQRTEQWPSIAAATAHAGNPCTLSRRVGFASAPEEQQHRGHGEDHGKKDKKHKGRLLHSL